MFGIFYITNKIIYLFDFLDKIRLQNFPKNWFEILVKDLELLENSLKTEQQLFDNSINSFNLKEWNETEGDSVAQKTGEVYFNLWQNRWPCVKQIGSKCDTEFRIEVVCICYYIGT